MNVHESIRYRLAYNAAARILEPLRGHNDGRREPELAEVLARVVREYGDAPEVREAVGDAFAERRPRW